MLLIYSLLVLCKILSIKNTANSFSYLNNGIRQFTIFILFIITIILIYMISSGYIKPDEICNQ